MQERLKTTYPEIDIDIWNRSFFKSLASCRLFICDNLASTFIDALALNKPTLLFWNPETNILRPEAEGYYRDLKREGVLYHNPEEAATALNSVYDDVEGWWDESQRKTAVGKFCREFALTSRNAVKEWAQELNRVAGADKKPRP